MAPAAAALPSPAAAVMAPLVAAPLVPAPPVWPPLRQPLPSLLAPRLPSPLPSLVAPRPQFVDWELFLQSLQSQLCHDDEDHAIILLASLVPVVYHSIKFDALFCCGVLFESAACLETSGCCAWR